MRGALLRRRDFEFQEATLVDIAKWMSKETGLLVTLDEYRIEEADIRLDQLIDLRLKQATLEQALDALPPKFGWWYRGGVIVITSDEAADTIIRPGVIDLRGLLNDDAFSDLEDILNSATPGEFFREGSGPPGLYAYAEPHYLLCKVPYRGQRIIARLTEELRWALK
jgi:hypothetical protein